MELQKLLGVTIGYDRKEHYFSTDFNEISELVRKCGFNGIEVRFSGKWNCKTHTRIGEQGPTPKGIEDFLDKWKSKYDFRIIHLSKYFLDIIKDKKIDMDILHSQNILVGHCNTADDIVNQENTNWLNSMLSQTHSNTKKRQILKSSLGQDKPYNRLENLTIENGSKPENMLHMIVEYAKALNCGITCDVGHLLLGLTEGDKPIDNTAKYVNPAGLNEKYKKIAKKIMHFHIHGLNNNKDHAPLCKNTIDDIKWRLVKQLFLNSEAGSITIEIKKEYHKEKILKECIGNFNKSIYCFNI